MAANRNSLERCFTSLEHTLKSTSTGLPKFINYIEKTPGLQTEDLKQIIAFLVECLAILSDELSSEEKFAKAQVLAYGEGSRDPPRIILNPELKATLQDPTDVSELETAVRTVYKLNADSTLGAVFNEFVDHERTMMTTMCGSIPKSKKKSRTCEML